VIWLVGSALAGGFEPPDLGRFDVVEHGPDGPGEIPDEGYEYEEPGNGMGYVGLGLLAVAGGTAIGMRQSKLAMENATCRTDLDDAYTQNKRRGWATYGALGGAALSFTAAVVF